ncbi:MAG: hypothetical protein IKU60_00840 [Clostridia bacterium]|nr:hypothetical protein [Clostridia bacterium]
MFVLVMIMLLLFPSEAQEGAREGLMFALENVIAAILPFAFLSGAMIFSGTAEKLGNIFAPLFKKLKMNPYGATAFVAGLLGGYPTGCNMACQMYSEGLFDKEECEKIVSYTNNGGLIFALNICGEMFGSKRAGALIFISSAISAFVAGLIFAKGNGEERLIHTKKLPFMAAMGKSIAASGSVLVNILSSFIVFYAVANALSLYRIPFLQGVFEMTKGLGFAGEVCSIPLGAFFFSLGGAGIFAQSAAICSGYDVGLKRYALCKIFQATLSFVITYMVVNRPFLGKDVILFSVLCVIAVVCAFKVIRRLCV